jgi:hypothetical protein
MRLQKYVTVLRGESIGLTVWLVELLEEADRGDEARCTVSCRDGSLGSTKHLWKTWRAEADVVTVPDAGGGV